MAMKRESQRFAQPVKGQKQLFRSRLVSWFRKAGRALPWRQTGDPYAILVSEVMLQQTQVAKVIAYYNRWLKRFPDIATLAGANEEDVLRMWEGLGYYSRARNLHRTAQYLLEQEDGLVPRDAAARANRFSAWSPHPLGHGG
jgi:A/G-specific adenine glycosylase